MKIRLRKSTATWAEDTALQRRNRSAAPRAKTGSGIKPLDLIPPVSNCFRDWHESERPSRQDAAKSPIGCQFPMADTNPLEFKTSAVRYVESSRNRKTPWPVGSTVWTRARKAVILAWRWERKRRICENLV
jgi:hypothetical protein